MNKKKKTLLAVAFIAGVFIIGLYGIDSSDGYLAVSELLSDPPGYAGQNINAMGIVEVGSLEKSPGMTSFELNDENDENLKIHVNYVGNLPSNLAEGKQVTISGTMVSESTFEANKIVTGCPSKYTE
ncbi:MAG: cytochrome c maturation protein CcmE [Methanosarcina sp.]|uniref:cytochrome c maturation protein CcmE domain-containing protein n=1 Tax=Methanosarcina sp. TaxID=2213 RepID=UPI00263306E9|nr:cytochrome c maturation protein CcmE [Methanosarcina sp.]MDD3247701.1 cytochrome c maturation protein CcmE [Methanosarcina sp.]MDD4249399.1 cytochrome c maturation protein CcmE [Methanosarcina sp.]